jgi:hypothetical protein
MALNYRDLGETVVSSSMNGVTAWANGFGLFLDFTLAPEALRRARRDGTDELAKAVIQTYNAARCEAPYRATLYRHAQELEQRSQWAGAKADALDERVVEEILAEDDGGLGLWTAGLRTLVENCGVETAELAKRTALSKDLVEDLIAGRFFPREEEPGVFDLLAKALGCSASELLAAGFERLKDVEPLNEENSEYRWDDERRQLSDGECVWTRVEHFLLAEVPLGEILARGILPDMLRHAFDDSFPLLMPDAKGGFKLTSPLEVAQRDHQSLGLLQDEEGRLYLLNIQSEEWRKLVELDDAAAQGETLTDEDKQWLIHLLGDPTWCQRKHRGRSAGG